MRTWSVAVVVVLIGLFAVSWWVKWTDKEEVAKLSIKQAEGDSISIPVGARGHIRYVVQNEGSTVIAIARVVPSCGCANARVGTMRLKPGESTLLTIGFKPAYSEEVRRVVVALGWRPEKKGAPEHSAEVITNVTSIAPFSVSAEMLAFKFARTERDPKELELIVWKGGQNLEWEDLRIESSDSYVAVRSPIKEGRKFIVKVDVDPSQSPLGVSTATVKIKALLKGGEVSTPVEIPIQISVASEISIEPESVYLGVVHKLGTATRIVHVTGLGEEPGLDPEVDPQSSDTVKAKVVRDENGWGVEVGVTPQNEGPGRTTIMLHVKKGDPQCFRVPVIWFCS